MASEKPVKDMQAQCGCGWEGKKWYLYMNARDELLTHARKEHGLNLRVVRHPLTAGEKS